MHIERHSHGREKLRNCTETARQPTGVLRSEIISQANLNTGGLWGALRMLQKQWVFLCCVGKYHIACFTIPQNFAGRLYFASPSQGQGESHHEASMFLEGGLQCL